VLHRNFPPRPSRLKEKGDYLQLYMQNVLNLSDIHFFRQISNYPSSAKDGFAEKFFFFKSFITIP